MQSTLKLRDSDPHDDFAIAPVAVPAAWADKVLADITRDARLPAPGLPPVAATDGAVAAPPVDTTFRATAIDDMPAPAEPPSSNRWAKRAVMLVFTLCSAGAAVAWQSHGDAARQMIGNWMPAFAASSSPPPEGGVIAQADTPAAQAPATEQTAPQPAVSVQQGAAPAVAAPTPETAQLDSMARDLASMAQQVEQLKASVAELKTSQQAMAREAAKTSEVRPAEIKSAAPASRPRTAAPPPRTAAAPPHRPLAVYPPAQAATPAALPQQVSPPVSALPAPLPQSAIRTEDGEPIVRPPMPLR